MIQPLLLLAANDSFGDKFNQFMMNIRQGVDTLGPIGAIILAILVFVVGRIFARMLRGLIIKALGKTDLDDKLAKMIGHESGAAKGIANFVYYLILLYLAIFALGVAELDEISGPLQDMLGKFLNFIPNIVGAGVLLFFVLIVAKVVKNLAAGVLDGAKLDERLGSKPGEKPVSSALVTALYCFIVLMFIPSVLHFLNIDSVSEPVSGVVNSILGVVPNIIVACILVAVGILIGQIARRLVTNLLDAAGANTWPSKLGLDVPQEGSRSLSHVVGLIVMISVAVLLISAAINVLEISILSSASEGFVEGYFRILLAVIIFGVGLLLSKFAYTNLADKNITLAKAARIGILVLTTVVALNRANLAPELTGLPYEYAIYALATAFGIGGAIAIGLGGKDYVARWLERKG
ncbi:mechanosensitive ion channel [Verrucomicrobiaceae bacterium R5-34]|uniref:Mechanosensitive ion channel n=1 Tax=Oceaniferula flava TaxID=2800421 RepID=A0AAE2SC99_9BACT|nr:mechanosensitive ion channel [Oceaniferula flavus]MBK1829665.1 mechanosensitive ion channel [Verrucomicrobiaceae bacterium R5-34]MBK1853855.1 mechanosensitive ion channel [Oceaniferula flavus]MBM1135161.1 mechanosensitive ion channel [Oceaniferula flavus]